MSDICSDSNMGSFVDEIESTLAFNKINIHPGMMVLDIGCGIGSYTKRFVEMGCEVVGVDIDPVMLDVAKESVPQARFIESSVYALPFKSEQFDLVFSMSTFEYIKNSQAAYYEMKRITKHGGQIFVGTINADSSWGKCNKTRELFSDGEFSSVKFMERADLEKIDRECLVDSSGAVYFDPETPKDHLNWEYENAMSKTRNPAFITALWKKLSN